MLAIIADNAPWSCSVGCGAVAASVHRGRVARRVLSPDDDRAGHRTRRARGDTARPQGRLPRPGGRAQQLAPARRAGQRKADDVTTRAKTPRIDPREAIAATSLAADQSVEAAVIAREAAAAAHKADMAAAKTATIVAEQLERAKPPAPDPRDAPLARIAGIDRRHGRGSRPGIETGGRSSSRSTQRARPAASGGLPRDRDAAAAAGERRAAARRCARGLVHGRPAGGAARLRRHFPRRADRRPESSARRDRQPARDRARREGRLRQAQPEIAHTYRHRRGREGEDDLRPADRRARASPTTRP